MTSSLLKDKNIIDVIKYKWLWVFISLCLIIPGVIAMIYSTATYESHTPLRVGIDFTGGTMLQYGFKKELQTEDIANIRTSLNQIGIENPVIQIGKKHTNTLEENLNKIETTENKDLKTQKDDINSILTIRTRFLSNEKTNNEIDKVNEVLKTSYGEFTPLQVNAIGPTLGKELFKNSIMALLLAFGGIVLYLTIRFQFDYAMLALVALFHDALFVCGVFSILGLFFNTEIDSLFITAILTVIGFSVHDTIVVFDRIRENSRFLAKKKTFNEIVNASVNQTLARSINTSVTSLITLLALYFLGGVTTRDFVLAMTLGIAIGTYSSIFNASTLLAMWRDRKNKPKKKACCA